MVKVSLKKEPVVKAPDSIGLLDLPRTPQPLVAPARRPDGLLKTIVEELKDAVELSVEWSISERGNWSGIDCLASSRAAICKCGCLLYSGVHISEHSRSWGRTCSNRIMKHDPKTCQDRWLPFSRIGEMRVPTSRHFLQERPFFYSAGPEVNIPVPKLKYAALIPPRCIEFSEDDAIGGVYQNAAEVDDFGRAELLDTQKSLSEEIVEGEQDLAKISTSGLKQPLHANLADSEHSAKETKKVDEQKLTSSENEKSDVKGQQQLSETVPISLGASTVAEFLSDDAAVNEELKGREKAEDEEKPVADPGDSVAVTRNTPTDNPERGVEGGLLVEELQPVDGSVNVHLRNAAMEEAPEDQLEFVGGTAVAETREKRSPPTSTEVVIQEKKRKVSTSVPSKFKEIAIWTSADDEDKIKKWMRSALRSYLEPDWWVEEPVSEKVNIDILPIEALLSPEFR